MIALLNFFEEASGETPQKGNNIIMWVIFGVLIVGMVLMMIIPNRKQKKRNEEMMARLCIGAIVTTIGGIRGEVVQLDEKYIWLLTGIDGDKTTMQFVRQAIHAIEPAPGSPEAKEEQKQAEKESEEIDEIR